jgi:hypothetical protein
MIGPLQRGPVFSFHLVTYFLPFQLIYYQDGGKRKRGRPPGKTQSSGTPPIDPNDTRTSAFSLTVHSEKGDIPGTWLDIIFGWARVRCNKCFLALERGIAKFLRFL